MFLSRRRLDELSNVKVRMPDTGIVLEPFSISCFTFFVSTIVVS
jgi:hypothetical protein